MRLTKIILCIIFVCIASFLIRCTEKSTVAGGTGSETVIGQLVNEDGTPAAMTAVTIRPSDYDPTSGWKPTDSGIATTDSKGVYSIILHSPTAVKYTMHAVNAFTKTAAIIQNLQLSQSGDSTFVAISSLYKTSCIRVLVFDTTVKYNGSVFIPGTDLHASVENGSAIIESVPAQLIKNISYQSSENTKIPQIIADSVDVKPGIVSIVTFEGTAPGKKLTINTSPSGGDIIDTVYNFPLLVRLNSGNFNFADAEGNGSDCRFTKYDNTPLPFEIERWDSISHLAEIWVRVDTIFGNDSIQAIYMYWGKAAQAIKITGKRVFDSVNGYAGVWHLDEEIAGVGSKGVYKDATGKNNGDDSLSAVDQSGIIGKGHAFDGIDDFILVNSPVANFEKGKVTISLWVNIADSGGTILSKLDTSPKWWVGETSLYFGDGTDSVLRSGVNGLFPSFVGHSDDYVISSQPFPLGDWHYLTYTWDWHGDSTGTARFYIDGKESGLSRNSLTIRYSENANAVLRIGQPNNNESYAYFKGCMDELEICTGVRNSSWIKLCYLNQQKGSNILK